MKRKVYVIHEIGIPSHYIALECLAREYNYKVVYHEFEYLFRGLFRTPFRTISNFIFLVSLLFRSSTKIVFAIAPYNRHLGIMNFLLSRHEVYYHTSYSCWDGTRYAHNPLCKRNIDKWHSFTKNSVKHIFAVSEKTKMELVKNGYAEEKNVTVVNHSYKYHIPVCHDKNKTNSFVYVGRLVAQKGILELLRIFADIPDAKLTIVGDGPLESKVAQYAQEYSNIYYEGHKNGFREIVPYYNSHSFLLLNSYKTPIWEELFGMVLIESMACGCVPIASNHPGPMEIITNHHDGFLFPEGNIKEVIKHACEMSNKDYQELRMYAIQTGRKYHCKSIAKKWEKIFE